MEAPAHYLTLRYTHNGKPCSHTTIADFFLVHDYGFPDDIQNCQDATSAIVRATARQEVRAIASHDHVLFVTMARTSQSLEDLGQRVRLFLNAPTPHTIIASPGAIVSHIGDAGCAYAGLLYALDRQWVCEITTLNGTRLYGSG